MRAIHTTTAIVLRNRPFGESDKIVSFFTEKFGKLTGIAKGALRSRKRFVNSLEPLALISLRFREPLNGSLAFVVAADLLDGHRRLLTSLERISYASYLVEISDGLVAEREENQAVFQHLRRGLKYLEETEPSLRFVTDFELKLLRLVGYQPMLDRCKRCCKNWLDNAAFQWHFSALEGGLLCDSCAGPNREIVPLDPAAIKILTALQTESVLPIKFSLPASVVREIRSVLLRFIQLHIDREIKSAPFLSTFSPV